MPTRVCKHESDDEDNPAAKPRRCDCPKFERRPDQDPNEPFRCRDCSHYEGWHVPDKGPESETVKGILQKCDEELGAIRKVKVKTSKAEAAQEALAGLRQDVEREKAGIQAKGKAGGRAGGKKEPKDKQAGKRINIRTVIMIPEGLDEEGNLICNITPSGDREEQLERWGLAVSASQPGDYWFCREWNNERFDEWLRGLFPQVFEFLDTLYGNPNERHWRLLKSCRGMLQKDRALPNGYAFNDAKGTYGKPWSESKIYLVICRPVPKRVYTNGWDVSQLNAATSSSESECDLNIDKGKAKRKAKQQSYQQRKRSASKAQLEDDEASKKGKKKVKGLVFSDAQSNDSDADEGSQAWDRESSGSPLFIWPSADEKPSLAGPSTQRPATRSQVAAATIVTPDAASTSKIPPLELRAKKNFGFKSPAKSVFNPWD